MWKIKPVTNIQVRKHAQSTFVINPRVHIYQKEKIVLKIAAIYASVKAGQTRMWVEKREFARGSCQQSHAAVKHALEARADGSCMAVHDWSKAHKLNFHQSLNQFKATSWWELALKRSNCNSISSTFILFWRSHDIFRSFSCFFIRNKTRDIHEI